MKNATKKNTTTKKTPKAMLDGIEAIMLKTNLTPRAAAALAKEQEAKQPAKAKAAKAKPAKATKKAAKPAKKTAAKKATASVPREFSKKAIVLDLLRRKGGATATELIEKTGWQKHTLRGFLSIANKKGEATITSAKNADGQRVYSA